MGKRISLGGGGGENHRPFYGQFWKAPSDETFVASRARDITLPSARAGFAAALQETIDHINEEAPANLDSLACHYRHFRGRFHAGLVPQYTVLFQPLASKLLDGVVTWGDKSRFQSKQVLYDILYNLEPALLDFPFDNWKKRPSRSVRQHLIKTSIPEYPPGRSYISETQTLRKKDQTRTRKRKQPQKRAIDLLREDFNAAKTGFAKEFLGDAYIRRAERAFRGSNSNSFSGPIQSKRVAVVMACSLF